MQRWWLRFSNQDDCRLNRMGSQSSIPFFWNLCSEPVGARVSIKCSDLVEDCDTGCPISVTVRMEYLFAFQFWYYERCVENWWEEGRKHCFVNFCSLAELSSRVDEVRWGGKSFPSRDFSRNNKHDTFWRVVSTGNFYVLFLWAIAVSDFRPLKIYKPSASTGLLLLLQSTATQITISINTFICFKYYTVWNQLFLLKYTLRCFIFVRNMVYRKKLFIEIKKFILF